MAERKLEIVFLGNAKPAQDAMRQVGESTGGLQAKVGGLEGAFSRLTTVAAGFVIGQGLLKAPGFLMDAAQAAAQDEQEWNRLEQAVRNAGGSFEENIGLVRERVAAGQKLAFTDSQVQDSFQTLLAATGDVNEALRRQKLAMDLARGANIDLNTASKLLGKATDENVNVLRRMGITLRDGATEADLFAAVQQKFGGQAETYAKSTAGQFEVLKIRLAEAKETIGYALLPVMVAVAGVLAEQVVPAIEAAATWISSNLGPAVEQVGGFVRDHLLPPLQSLGEWFAGNESALQAVGVAIGTVLVAAFLAWAVSAGAAAVATIAAAAPVIAIGVAIAALGAGIFLLVKHWNDLEQKYPPLQAATAAVKEALAAFASWITDSFVPAVAAIATAIVEAVEKAVSFVREHWHEIEDIIRPALEALKLVVQTAWDQIRLQIETALGVIKGVVDVFMGVFTGDWDRAWQGVKGIFGVVWNGLEGTARNAITLLAGLAPLMLEAAKGLGSALKDGIVSGIKGIAENVGEIAQALIDAFRGAVNRALRWLHDNVRIEVPGFDPPGPGSIPGFSWGFPLIQLARGVRDFRGGLALVGEEGPELVHLPRGADVLPAGETRQLLSQSPRQGGVTVTTGDVVIYARDPEQGRQSLNDLAYGLVAALRARGVA
ncbi:MAG: phage tail protein [Ignavibacteriales bacterium]